MKLKAIAFENYKGFQERQRLELRPITLLIGKNSSGKSSIAKLMPLLSRSLSGKIDEPLQLVNNDVTLGAEFRDLIYNRVPSIPVMFSLEFENGVQLLVNIVQQVGDYKLTIFEWKFLSPEFKLELRVSKGNVYVDNEGAEYICTFSGLLPRSIINNEGVDIADKITSDFSSEVDYIGPFRALPQRQFNLSGQITFPNTGVMGEHAYEILGVSKLMNDQLHKTVGEWYEAHFDGWKLVVEDNNRSLIEIHLQKNDTDVNIVDVGQGMNQILPLVVRSLIARPGSTIVLEQPELHLHPAAHGDIGTLFAGSSKDNDQRFIIETHSENLILRIRKLVIENYKDLKPEDVIIYWVDDAARNGHQLKEITIDETGTLTDWPPGVFNENLIEIQQIRKAIADKKRGDDRKI